ncbi:hypothetical protein [Terricaulis sp.]|uniref:hypothetical protein n=1 Tax=Terricaulis sp. TaxID=2768686 RepID=UPI003784DCCC
MHKILLAALSAAVIFASGAAAGTVENSFGHTVVSRTSDGHESRWQYFADGTYTMTMNNETTRGAWAYVNGQLCLTPAGGQQSCYTDTGDHHVGDTWTMPGANNTTVTIHIE